MHANFIDKKLFWHGFYLHLPNLIIENLEL